MTPTPHPKFKANAALTRLNVRIKNEEYSASVHRKDYEEVVAYIAELEAALSDARTMVMRTPLRDLILDRINKVLPEPQTDEPSPPAPDYESCKNKLLSLKVGVDTRVSSREELNRLLFIAKSIPEITVVESNPNRPSPYMIRRTK